MWCNKCNDDFRYCKCGDKNEKASSSSSQLSGSGSDKRWRIKRWVLEEYEEYAPDRATAIEQCEDPATITITKQTCVREDLD